MAGEPLLPREDVIAYAASKRKSEDAPFTATTTITPSSSSGDAKAGGYKQLLEEGEEPPAAARGGVWGAFDAARQWVGDVVGSAYEYVNKRCGIETKIRQARSCARISIRKCVPAPIQKRLPCFGWIDEALKPGPMYDDEPKTLEGIQKKTDEMRAAFREDAQRRLAKLAGGSLPVKPVTVRPNQQGSAKAMAERIVSSAEEKKNAIERWTAQQLKGSSTDDEDSSARMLKKANQRLAPILNRA